MYGDGHGEDKKARLASEREEKNWIRPPETFTNLAREWRVQYLSP